MNPFQSATEINNKYERLFNSNKFLEMDISYLKLVYLFLKYDILVYF